MKKLRLLIILILAGILTVAPESVAAPQVQAATQAPAAIQAVPEGKYMVESPLRAGVTGSINFDECERDHTNGQKFLFEDKFTMCRSEEVSVDYWEMSSSGPVWRGATDWKLTQIGVANDRTNKIVFGIRITWIRTRGIIDALNRLAIQFGCRSGQSDRVNTCDHSQLFPQKTIDQWRSERGSDPYYWTTTATTTQVPPGDKYASELRGRFDFDFTLTVSGGPVPPDDYTTPTESFRCDSATYVNGPKCLFDNVIPAVVFDANDPEYSQSALFIRKAQDTISQTKPGLPGTKVPGKAGEAPLTRLYKAYDTEKDIRGSRNKIRKVCEQGWTLKYAQPLQPGGPRRSCDEYPFATTYQNAALVNEKAPGPDPTTKWGFAVEVIDAGHNEKAGSLYGAWLTRNHILDGDPFYVIVR